MLNYSCIFLCNLRIWHFLTVEMQFEKVGWTSLIALKVRTVRCLLKLQYCADDTCVIGTFFVWISVKAAHKSIFPENSRSRRTWRKSWQIRHLVVAKCRSGKLKYDNIRHKQTNLQTHIHNSYTRYYNKEHTKGRTHWIIDKNPC